MMDSDDDDIYPTNEPSSDTRNIKQENPEEEGEEVEDDSDVRMSERWHGRILTYAGRHQLHFRFKG
jgi:hypothetical protein